MRREPVTSRARKASTAQAAMNLTPSKTVQSPVPNAQTRAAMAEVDEMVKTRTARFASADELFAELEEASNQ